MTTKAKAEERVDDVGTGRSIHTCSRGKRLKYAFLPATKAMPQNFPFLYRLVTTTVVRTTKLMMDNSVKNDDSMCVCVSSCVLPFSFTIQYYREQQANKNCIYDAYSYIIYL